MSRNNPFWNKHRISQVTPQHPDHDIAKKPKIKKEDYAKEEGEAPSIKNASNDASLKHIGY